LRIALWRGCTTKLNAGIELAWTEDRDQPIPRGGGVKESTDLIT
jgi:hypothetical protein